MATRCDAIKSHMTFESSAIMNQCPDIVADQEDCALR